MIVKHFSSKVVLNLILRARVCCVWFQFKTFVGGQIKGTMKTGIPEWKLAKFSKTFFTKTLGPKCTVVLLQT